MAKMVDTELINSRIREREAIVNNGKFIESIEAKGETASDLVESAKNILGIDENDSIIATFEEKLAEQNLKTKAFMSLVNFISKAEDGGLLSTGDILTVRAIELKLALNISETYNIELDDLYTEEQ